MKPQLAGLLSFGMTTVVLASSAFAAPPTLYQLTNGIGFTDGDLIGSINYTGNPPNYPAITFNGDVYIGPLNLQVTNLSTSQSQQQTVYCTDIFDDYSSGGLYTLSATNLTTQLAAELGSLTEANTKVNQINGLLSNALPLDKPSGAAIQAAVWEIENEPGVTGYSLTAGKFTASVDAGDQAAFAADATADLAAVSGTSGSNGIWQPAAGQPVYEFVAYPVGTSNQSFSFLSLSGGGNNIPLPEPASLSVLGLGVLGLAAVHRRRTSKRTA
jgi:MYXO-CTERM domain-containing protein